MKTRHLIVASILAGWGNATVVFAQALNPPPTNSTAPFKAPAAPATAPVPPPAAPKSDSAEDAKAQSLSSGVSAAISAGMPKYTPPPKAPEPKPGEQLADLRETDKPKNQIIRLPEVVVREPRNPVLRERDVNTKVGLAALAERRYITDADRTLNRWNIFGVRSTSGGNSTTNRALAMYAEDERLQNMADLNEAAGLASATDKAAGVYIRRETQQMYRRSDEFGGNGSRAKE